MHRSPGSPGNDLNHLDLHACEGSGLDPRDELKPEVVAPGEEVSTATLYPAPGFNISVAYGTSVASPHVAGLIALAKQVRPTMNPASSRNLVIRTAQQFGAPSLPSVDPLWNNQWGWGLVDAYEALSEVQPSPASSADPQFDSSPGVVPWLSPNISIAPFPYPKPGIVNQVTATVYNPGPGVATDVDVQFGVYTLSPTPVAFEHIGTGKIPSIAPGTYGNVTIAWKPKSAKHASLAAEIGFGGDADYSNNRAKLSFAAFNRNMSFPVQNLFSSAAEEIDLEVSCMAVPGGSTEGWTVTLDPSSVVLSGNDRPQDVTIEVTPPPGVSGRIMVEVTARVESNLVGGLTLEGVVSSEPEQGLMSSGLSSGGTSGSTFSGILDPAVFAQVVLSESAGAGGPAKE